MKKIFFLLVFGSVLFIGCQDKNVICDDCNGLFSEDLTMYIYEEKVPCEGDSTRKCYMEQHGGVFSDTAWTAFDKDICGFDFVPGYRYKLTIKRKKIGKDNNGNKVYKYCLLRILESKKVYL